MVRESSVLDTALRQKWDNLLSIEDEQNKLISTVSEILPGRLYQSGSPLTSTSEKLVHDLGIDISVNLYGLHPIRSVPVGKLFKEITFPFPDGYLADSTIDLLEELSHELVDELSVGKNILVRCQMGLNRSSLLIGMMLHDLNLEADIVEYIRKRRSEDALFNPHFERYIRYIQRNQTGRYQLESLSFQS